MGLLMMAMIGMERISTPWRLRLHRFRYTTLPLPGSPRLRAADAFCCGPGRARCRTRIGEIEAIRVDVAVAAGRDPDAAAAARTVVGPLRNGRANAGPWPSWTIEPLQAEMATLVQELGRLKKEIDAVRAKLAVSEADRGLTYMSDAVRLYVELEQRSLVALERQAEVAVNRHRVPAEDCLLQLPQAAVRQENRFRVGIEQRPLSPRRGRERRLAENTKVVGEAETQKKIAARERVWTNCPSSCRPISRRSWPRSSRQSRCRRRRSSRCEVQIGLLTIRSPVHGMICAINHWPQSAIQAGDPIVTMASDERRYLVCYVRQEQHVDPKAGMDVDVRKRAAISPTMHTVVERVGPQIELIPVHICRDPKYARVGRARPHHPAGRFCRSSGRALRGHVQDPLEEQR